MSQRGARRRAIGTAALALACAAGGAPPPDPGPQARLDALFPEGRRTQELEALLERAELAPGEDLRVVDLGRDAHTSHHLVAIRHAETPHRHDRHDLLVVVLRGHGALQIGDERRPLGEGSILYVPRGAVHAFRNAGPEPAVAYVVYTPAFDGEDRILSPPP